MCRLEIITNADVGNRSGINSNTLTGARWSIHIAKLGIQNSINVELGIKHVRSSVVSPRHCDMVPFRIRNNSIADKKAAIGFDPDSARGSILSLNPKSPFLRSKICAPRDDSFVKQRAIGATPNPSGNGSISCSRNPFVTNNIDLVVNPIKLQRGRRSGRNCRQIGSIPNRASYDCSVTIIRRTIPSCGSGSFIESPMGNQISPTYERRKEQH